MSEVIEWLKGKKTYIICVAAVLTAFGGWLNDQITFVQFLQAAWAAITGMTIRAGITKSGKS